MAMSRSGVAWLSSCGCVGIVALGWFILTDVNYTELRTSRPNDDDVIISLVVAGLCGIVTFAAIVRYRPPFRYPVYIHAPVLGLCAVLFGLVMSLSLLDHALEIADFHLGPVTSQQEDLSVERAYQSTGKGNHYHLVLTDYAEGLAIDRDTFVNTFGDVKEGDYIPCKLSGMI